MIVNEKIKRVISEHKNEVEIFQWSVINSIASLVYSEYISNMKQKTIPTKVILVPKVKLVSDLLSPSGELMNTLSNNLIDMMISNHFFIKYDFKNIKELILFTEDYIDILKSILSSYILPNIARLIPDVIVKKFQLDVRQSSIIESPESVLFNGMGVCRNEYIEYIVEEICIQMFTEYSKSIPNSITEPDDIFNIQLSKDDILVINHENAICPIYFSAGIFENKTVLDLLKFVACIDVTKLSDSSENIGLTRYGQYIKYCVKSHPYNHNKVIHIEDS